MDPTFLAFWGVLITALRQPIHIRNWTRDIFFAALTAIYSTLVVRIGHSVVIELTC